MKTIKRILAVALLIITITAVGYLVYTGGRFSFNGDNYQGLIGNTYTNKENNVVVYFNEENSIEYRTENGTFTLQQSELKDEVIICQDEEEQYRFVIISEQVLYDVNTKQVLWRTNNE